MKPLATNRRVLNWLCICPFDQNTSIWQKALVVASTWFLFTSEISCAVSSVVFFINNVSVALEDSVCAIMQIAGISSVVYTWMVAFILRDGINRILKTLDEIYEESISQ